MDKELAATKVLTLEESYKVMYAFLEGYYQRLNRPDLLAMLLGGFRLRDHISTVDPAAWEDWLDAVAAVLKEGGQAPSEQ